MTKIDLDLKLLEELCEAFGPSGHEEEAQKVAKKHGQKYADEVL